MYELDAGGGLSGVPLPTLSISAQSRIAGGVRDCSSDWQHQLRNYVAHFEVPVHCSALHGLLLQCSGLAALQKAVADTHHRIVGPPSTAYHEQR